MAKEKPETIILRVSPGGCAIFDEYKAKSVLSPGHMVQILTASANRGQIDPVGTRGVRLPRKFAVENDFLGKDITDAYAVGARVQVVTFQPGEHVYARVAAAAPAIVEGDILNVTATGTLEKHSSTYDRMAMALEDVDNSSGTSEVFLSAEII